MKKKIRIDEEGEVTFTSGKDLEDILLTSELINALFNHANEICSATFKECETQISKIELHSDCTLETLKRWYAISMEEESTKDAYTLYQISEATKIADELDVYKPQMDKHIDEAGDAYRKAVDFFENSLEKIDVELDRETFLGTISLKKANKAFEEMQGKVIHFYKADELCKAIAEMIKTNIKNISL